MGDSPILAVLIAIALGALMGFTFSLQALAQRLAREAEEQGRRKAIFCALPARLALAGISLGMIFAVAHMERIGSGLPRHIFAIVCFFVAFVLSFAFYHLLWKPYLRGLKGPGSI